MKRIGDILTRYKEAESVQDDMTYKQVTIGTHYKGVRLRGKKIGSAIGTKNQWLVRAGQFILSRIDARNSAFGIIPDDLEGALVTNDFMAYEVNEDEVDRDFFNTFLRSPQFLEACIKASRGNTNRKRVQEEFFLNYRIDLPDIDQQRVLIKKIKRAQHAMAVAEIEITNQQTLLTKLKQAILQEAIQGKLTADWRAKNPDTEPASELLKRIQTEKARLIAEKKIRKEKPLPEITPEEIPFEIPDRWTWCRLGDIGNATNYPLVDGPFGSAINTKKDYLPKGVPVLRMMNIKPFRFISEPLKFVSEETYQKFSRHNVLADDILFSKVGAGIGEACIVPQNFNYGMLSTTGITRMRVGQVASSTYVCYFLNLNIGAFMKMARKSSQPFLNMTQIKSFLFPLPPLAEQAAIVARVEALMATCRELESEIESSRTHAADLLQAVLKEAFSPTS